VTELELIRHLCGADDPDERADLRERIAEDPRLQAKVAGVEQALAQPLSERRWALPPPGWGGLSLAAEARAMGGDQGHALVFALPDAVERLVVVLWNTGQGWEVLTPTGPDDLLRPAELPQDGRGQCVIDVVLPAGRSTWAVALPRPDQGPDWAAPEPWARFRGALFAGEVPVQVVPLGAAVSP
jgi:hypothetical protein